MKVYAVIMAGGVGARFWPKSREKQPKQLLKIFNEKSLIQNTVSRLEGIVEKENIFIVTNKIQKPGIVEQLPGIPEQNVIEEPFGKNTAACIGLASVLVEKNNEDAITLILPADHMITDNNKFRDTITKAAKFAEKENALVTIGITPDRPETGYGYIQTDDLVQDDDIFNVKTFAEKPTLETAKRFVESGDFLWNSGMFIWKVSVIMEQFNSYMPNLYEGLLKIKSAIGAENFEEVLVHEYRRMKSISIDYGVMEKSQKVCVVKGFFDWNDVGSWEAVYQLSEKDSEKNVGGNDILFQDTTNSYVNTNKKFTALVGVDNLVVIETEDALLICDRNQAQSVKQVVDHLKLHKKNDLL